jgi:hypothetical protein
MLIPNWTPKDWWEADIAKILPSGRWHEIEIKISKADFQADAKKCERIPSFKIAVPNPTKHERLAAGDTKGPNQFYFALTESVAEQVKVPDWAGLYVVGEYNNNRYVRIEKKAPVLHKGPFQFQAPEGNVFYYRMWAHLQKLERARKAA